MAMRKQMVRVIESDRADAKERIECLRLQAFAWRQLALIAIHDPAYAKRKVGALMMMSVPFVNEPFLRQFIAEHETMAEECGKQSGVFSA